MLTFLGEPMWQGIGVLIGIIIAGIGFYYSSKRGAWLYIPGVAIAAFFGGFYVGQGHEIKTPPQFRQLEIEIPDITINRPTNNAITKIMSVNFKYPNIATIRGRVENLHEDTKIWMYVLSNDKRYYFKNIHQNTDGTWRVSEIQIGDIDIDNKTYVYEVGIIQVPLQGCSEVQIRVPIDENHFPLCANKIQTFTVTRH